MNASIQSKENEFLVRESAFINFVVAGALLLLFVVALMNASDMMSYVMAFGLFLTPGIVFLYKGLSKKIFIRINAQGIFFRGKLMTDWRHFYDAQVRDGRGIGSIQDKFLLDVRYYSPDGQLLHKVSIPLTNTQDQAEEDVLAATYRFYKAYRTQTG